MADDKKPMAKAPDRAKAAVAGQHVRLGKGAPKHDSRTLQLAKYLAPEALPSVPTRVGHATGLRAFPMLGNDQYGDCTCAALGHAWEVWQWRDKKGAQKQANASDILNIYWATGSQDDGRMMLDVLNYVRHNGLVGKQVTAFAQLDPKNHALFRAAVYLFGGVYIGVNLPTACQRATKWTGITPSSPGGAPGSWGGHAIFVPAYGSDKAGVTAITWGKRITIGWDFLDYYCDEAWAIIESDWVSSTAASPQGFDMSALTTDLSQI